ncbi:MAG: hypothetical protein AB7I33_03765 [Gemmatimonadales bacterium]
MSDRRRIRDRRGALWTVTQDGPMGWGSHVPRFGMVWFEADDGRRVWKLKPAGSLDTLSDEELRQILAALLVDARG